MHSLLAVIYPEVRVLGQTVVALGAAIWLGCGGPAAPPARSRPIVGQPMIQAPARPIEAPPVQVTTKWPGACSDSIDFMFPSHSGADGVADEVDTRTFDAAGRPISLDLQRGDAPHRVIGYEYDADGRLTREVLRLADPPASCVDTSDSCRRIAATGDPSISVTTYRYDAAGHLVEQALDEDVDGTPDYLELRRYDAAGRMTELREQVHATTRKGGVRHGYRYDAAGRLAVEAIDDNHDGRADLQVDYAYDADGRLARKVSHYLMHPSPDRPIDEIFVYKYDAAGRVIAETDRDGEGFTWSYLYDAAGNLIAKEYRPPVRAGVDQTLLDRIDYSYDCWPRETTSSPPYNVQALRRPAAVSGD